VKIFKTGDRVVVINEPVKGIVTGIKSQIITVLTDDGFDFDYPASKLIHDTPLDIDFAGNFDLKHKEKSSGKPTSKKHLRPGELVIDLHIHELIENTRNMSNFEMLTIQLDKVKTVLKNTDRKTIRKITFIHGKGTGKLKQEIENILTAGQYNFYQASLKDYGNGALTVEL
jgi:hypothetical protein